MAVAQVDIGATMAGLDALLKRVDNGVAAAVADGLHLLQLVGAANAPVGTLENSTNPPGDLARSIDVEGPHGADGVYEGEVGPTTIYGRQRELGGDIPGDLAKSIDVEGRARTLHFFTFGREVFTRHVYQVGAHYMLKTYEEVVDGGSLEVIGYERMATAIAGS